MSIARKTQAKYGAQIPTAPKPGAKAAQPAGKPGASAGGSGKASQGAKGGGDKKG